MINSEIKHEETKPKEQKEHKPELEIE